jgi:NAD(P)-dependent dehydrogenase (short-subunit alcohol dehydrogenase family)
MARRLSDALRLEMAAFGIRVVLIEPGHMETSFNDTVNATSGTIINNKNSIYYGLYKNFIAYLTATRRSSAGPEVVSSVIQRAIEAKRPAARYMANVPFAMKFLLSLGDVPKDLFFKTALKIKSPLN